MKEGDKTYGLTEEQWEEYENELGEIVLRGLIKSFSYYFRRNFARKQILRGRTETVVVPVETGLGQPTVGVELNSQELEIFVNAGKKMQDEVEYTGRGIVRHLKKSG